MDNNQGHEKIDTLHGLNGVDGEDLTKALFNDFNEPVLPLEPLASDPQSHSPDLGGQPLSSAGVPWIFERTEQYPPPVLPLHGERQAHSFSLSLRHPGPKLPGPHELPMQEQSRNIFPSKRDSPRDDATINGSRVLESGSDSVHPLSDTDNENPRPSTAFRPAVFAPDLSPNPDECPPVFSDTNLKDHDPVSSQTESNGPMLGQNVHEMQGLTYPLGYPRSSGNMESLHAARILQDIVQKSTVRTPIASSQHLPFLTSLQPMQTEIGMPENAAYDALDENVFDPIKCPPNPQMQTSLAHSMHANLATLPDFNAQPGAVPSAAHHSVGSSMGGALLTGESQYPQRNSSCAIITPRTVSSKVLSDIVIDRALLDKANILEKGLHKAPEFELFCQSVREKNMASGQVSIGGTVRRRPDLIKPIENLTEFGYPPCDVQHVQKILDTIPGLDKHTVEYLKLTVLCQLDRIRRGAREAVHQLSAILIDHLRFRIMTQTDVLDLQCKVVDRFVVARDCVLERYSHYVKSRRWIENMSTNQRRGCLSHQQNNIMRMWLYQNFKNPYPDEEEKAYIVQETNLTMEQVNNWLINARSRFWKPAMDYFQRDTLEMKMSAFIHHRLTMTPETRAKAVKKIGAASTHKGAKR